MADSDLLFKDPPAASGALVFGATDTPVAGPPITVEAAATLGGVAVSAFVSVPLRVEAVVLLGGVAVHAVAAYDNRVTRWLDQRAVVPAQPSARTEQPSVSSGWGLTQRERGGTAMPWDGALPQSARPTIASQPADPVRGNRTALWTLADRVAHAGTAPHQSALGLLVQRIAPWQQGDNLRAQSASTMQAGVAHQQTRSASWQRASARHTYWLGPVGASLHRTGKQWSAMPWQQAVHPAPGVSALPPIKPPFDPCYLPDAHLLFSAPWVDDTGLVFICERHTPGPDPEPGATVVVPIRNVYMTLNNVTLVRVDGAVPIPAYSFGMSIDVDSWTWQWQATLHADALALIQPGSNGDPVDVLATINGTPYRLCIENFSRQRQFGQTRIAVKGRGRAAILDAPYAPVSNHGNAAARTAQQLMADVLTVNGVGIGWDVDWRLTDWLVPGNAWAHQGSYISAILDIAGAAGGYVQPHSTLPTLRVLPRYPAAPWQWGTLTPDFELPSAVVSVEGIDWQRKAAYDRVFVSGANASGVLGQVTRGGTAGGNVAPMVTHPLITHADAARQRGMAELGDTGRQAHISLRLPVLAETGVIQPGALVRYVDGGDTHLGLVRGTSVDWSRPTLRQTLAVETHPA